MQRPGVWMHAPRRLMTVRSWIFAAGSTVRQTAGIHAHAADAIAVSSPSRLQAVLSWPYSVCMLWEARIKRITFASFKLCSRAELTKTIPAGTGKSVHEGSGQ